MMLTSRPFRGTVTQEGSAFTEFAPRRQTASAFVYLMIGAVLFACTSHTQPLGEEKEQSFQELIANPEGFHCEVSITYQHASSDSVIHAEGVYSWSPESGPYCKLVTTGGGTLENGTVQTWISHIPSLGERLMSHWRLRQYPFQVQLFLAPMEIPLEQQFLSWFFFGGIKSAPGNEVKKSVIDQVLEIMEIYAPNHGNDVLELDLLLSSNFVEYTDRPLKANEEQYSVVMDMISGKLSVNITPYSARYFNFCAGLADSVPQVERSGESLIIDGVKIHSWNTHEFPRQENWAPSWEGPEIE